ncbi:MAG: DUF1292 domain-containing protein [Erysipelotrichaceae bacterium]
MLDSKSLFVNDEQGNEVEMEILFTFDNEEKTKSYVVFQNPANEDGEVYASQYDDEGNLLPVETDAEWEMIEEVIGSFSTEGTEE